MEDDEPEILPLPQTPRCRAIPIDDGEKTGAR